MRSLLFIILSFILGTPSLGGQTSARLNLGGHVHEAVSVRGMASVLTKKSDELSLVFNSNMAPNQYMVTISTLTGEQLYKDKVGLEKLKLGSIKNKLKDQDQEFLQITIQSL